MQAAMQAQTEPQGPELIASRLQNAIDIAAVLVMARLYYHGNTAFAPL
jgi:hypothetical protein